MPCRSMPLLVQQLCPYRVLYRALCSAYIMTNMYVYIYIYIYIYMLVSDHQKVHLPGAGLRGRGRVGSAVCSVYCIVWCVARTRMCSV